VFRQVDNPPVFFYIAYMNPIQYVKMLRWYLCGGVGVSGIGLGSMLIFVDPTINSLYIIGFLLLLMIFFTSLIGLFGMWWLFDEKRRLLTIAQINWIIYQSLFSSTIVILLLVMSQTNMLNIFTSFLVGGGYVLYQLWSQSQ
jgi:hypothetical protein